MGPFELARLGELLARLARGPRGDATPRGVGVTRGTTSGGTPFDRYVHRDAERATWIAVPGVTLQGGRDPRLIHLGNCLAQQGVTCVVPTLRGLSSCRWATEDVDALCEVVRLAAERSGKPVGLLGFSYGGSYALLAAARLRGAQVHRVITFGAYHTAQDLYDRAQAEHRRRRGAVTNDDVIYRDLVLIYGQDDRDLLPASTWQAMESLLRRYCHDADLAEKQQFHERHVSPLDLAQLFASWRRPELLAAVSPADQLSTVSCPVTLIHDRADGVVPVAHAKRLAAELRTTMSAPLHQLCITSLLSHVSPANVLNLGETWHLAQSLAPLVQ